MRLALLVSTLVGLVVLFGAGGCGVSGDELVVPPAVRSQVASDFPDFVVIDAQGSTVTGAGGANLVEQDVIFTLKTRSGDFYMTQQYNQVYPAGHKPPGWKLSSQAEDEFGAPNLRGRLDAKAVAFVDAFSRQHPGGTYVYNGASAPVEPGSHSFEAWVYPRQMSDSNGCSASYGRSETYTWDPASRSWSPGE